MSNSINSAYNDYNAMYFALQQKASEKPSDTESTTDESQKAEGTTSNSTGNSTVTADDINSTMGSLNPFWADTKIPTAEDLKAQLEAGMEGVNFENAQNSNIVIDAQTLNALSQAAAKDLGKEKITHADLMEHRDYLTNIFAAKTKVGLAEAGVDEDADFRVSLDAEGKIAIQSNHADKAKIEKFFKENPELAGDFQHIEMLNQLESTRKNQSYNLSAIMTQTRQMGMALMGGGAGYNAMGASLGANSMASMGYGSTTMALTGSGDMATLLQKQGISTTV